jgi:hypothetical protein
LVYIIFIAQKIVFGPTVGGGGLWGFGQILLRGVLGVVKKSRRGPLFSCFIAFLCANFAPSFHVSCVHLCGQPFFAFKTKNTILWFEYKPSHYGHQPTQEKHYCPAFAFGGKFRQTLKCFSENFNYQILELN